MSKQPILHLLFFSLVLLVVFAFNKKKKPKETLLWEITSPNTKEKSYLFGTIHLIEKEFFKFPESLKEKIQSSKKIIFELPYPNNTSVRDLLIFPGKNILNDFSENEKIKILNWFKQHLKIAENDFLSNYSEFKPFVLAQTIIQFQFLDNSISYEQEIYKVVKSKSIQIEGLESINDQLKVLDSIPYQTQLKNIITAIDSFDIYGNTLKEIQLAYKNQDLKKIYQWMLKDASLSSYPLTSVLDERNKKWISSIEKNINQSSTFIAVGAGHLAGENGLIELLKRKGYKLKSIYYE